MKVQPVALRLFPLLSLLIALVAAALARSSTSDAAAVCVLDPGDPCSFGWDQEGQLGNGAGQADQDEPSPILGLANIVDVAAGGKHSLALLADGTLRGWDAISRARSATVAQTRP